MALNHREKQSVIAKVNEVAKNAISAVVADFRGVTVNKMTELRKSGREEGVYIHVLRNTLARRIVAGTPFECLKEIFIGPTLIAFSTEHPGAAARLFDSFSKNNEHFKIKVAAFEGKVIPASQVIRLATLPTYEEAIELLMSSLKYASAGKLVRTLTILLRDKKTQTESLHFITP